MHGSSKILALFLFVSGNLFGQLQIRNYFSVTGKKDVPVNMIAQDLNGLLLLGTSEGVYIFDGKSSVALSGDPVLKKDVTAIFTNSDEAIWIGTRDGNVYFVKKNKIDSISFAAMPNTEKITSFFPVAGGMCIGTYGNGIYCYTGKLQHFYTGNGLSDNVIYKLTGDRKSTIWCGTDAGITEIKSLPEQPVFKIVSNKNGLPDNIVRNISLDDHSLLVSMQDSGVCHYNFDKGTITRDPYFKNWQYGPVLNSCYNRHSLIVATERQGVIQVDHGTTYFYHYDEKIQASSINQMFVDRARLIWVASKKGISQFTTGRLNVINAANGLTDEKVLALAADNENFLWIGTPSGIYRLVNTENGTVKEEKIRNADRYTISCAARAPNGDMWFGTYGNGILIVNPHTKTSLVVNSKDNQLSNDNISNIHFADKNTVYISTLGGGLTKLHIDLKETSSSFRIEKNYTRNEGLGSDYVYSAITDNNGKLYVGTDGGGLQVLEKSGFVNLTQKYHLGSSTVFSLSKDRHNSIWATSNADGILKYDGKKLTTIKARDGLRDEQPQQILAIGNTLLAVNSKGIDKINCHTNSISYYDVGDKELEPNLNCVLLVNDKLYSGTSGGILIYRSGQEREDSIKPVVYVKSLQVNYKPFPLDSDYKFKHDQNNISITFDGIWLKNPDKLLYRYRLNGIESEWLYANEGKTISYNNLGAGAYTFIVQAKNEEDMWSEPEGYSFIIQAPIWKHWWFWVLVAGAFAVCMFTFIRYRLKALQRENIILEQRVAERTYEIEKQSHIIEDKNRELERLSLVASKTDNVVVILDSEGRLEYINESFEKQNNVSIDLLKKEHGETIYELSNNPNIRQIIDDAVSNRKSVNYESLNRKVKTTHANWQSSTLTPLFDDNGDLKNIIIIDTDVTERKKQEQIIIQKNKDITDSISYAKKIQHAILPPEIIIKKYLPQSFVFYLTKDIVSGDFYWFTHFDNFSIIAAVDCTGHGVPGAFMSLIGYNLLNRIVNEKKITDPADILLELNNGVLGVLHKNESESKDGMDIAICKINHDSNLLEYAGAMRPLWVINNKVLREVKADKIPIGTKQKDRTETIAYTTHQIQLAKGDSFYIFTDGYADQFGGPKDKKYSTSRFKELLANNSAEGFAEQEKNIRAEHIEWKGNNEQIDDILVIGFSV